MATQVHFMDSLKFFLSLYGHKLPVLSMDISSDSSLLISGSADKNIKIWGLDFGDCHRSLFAHADSIMQARAPVCSNCLRARARLACRPICLYLCSAICSATSRATEGSLTPATRAISVAVHNRPCPCAITHHAWLPVQLTLQSDALAWRKSLLLYPLKRGLGM